MALNFAIDGGTMTNQPALIRVTHRMPPEDVAVNGGIIGIPWTNNRTVTVTWYDSSAHTTITELNTARGGNRAHTITWNDPDGTARTVKSDWAYDPDYTIATGYIYGEITVEFKERPD